MKFKKKRQQTWVTNRVKNLISQRDNAFEKWIEESSIINRNHKQSLRNKVTNEITTALSSKLPNLVYVSTIPRITKTTVLNITTTEEITKINRSLKSKKRTGCDGISIESLKCFSLIKKVYVADVSTSVWNRVSFQNLSK